MHHLLPAFIFEKDLRSGGISKGKHVLVVDLRALVCSFRYFPAFVRCFLLTSENVLELQI